jgi:hypothetical protein
MYRYFWITDNNRQLTEILSMKYTAGTSGNPKGRPKGTTKTPIKSRIERLLEKSLPRIEEEMETATPEVRREFFTDLAGVVLSANKL